MEIRLAVSFFPLTVAFSISLLIRFSLFTVAFLAITVAFTVLFEEFAVVGFLLEMQPSVL
ncbi:hypothetical protein [Prevotella conceptionensis]|jgi:hypothetical protein|uniref:hypothetical protein n=1 Tax=Prevotella conceptionensis TaxID=340486 RepID=UPI0005CB5AEA|nr:hypothetical protein [Prevotella conceptionensis]